MAIVSAATTSDKHQTTGKKMVNETQSNKQKHHGSGFVAMFKNMTFRRGSNDTEDSASSSNVSNLPVPATPKTSTTTIKKAPSSRTAASNSNSVSTSTLGSSSSFSTVRGSNRAINAAGRPPSHPAPKPAMTKLDCSKEVHANEIKFELVDIVIKSWEREVKANNPHWLTVGGELFLRQLFRLCPETIEMFGFPKDTQYDNPHLVHDAKFMGKGKRLIKAIDIAIGFLGPDLSCLEQTLFELGTRHVERQCRPYHWPIVGEALFAVFEEILGDAWTPELREAWTILYNFLGYHMIQGLLHECPALATETQPPTTTTTTTTSSGNSISNTR